MEIGMSKIYDVRNVNEVIVDGDTSDGYHTFNELYFHRMVLFAVIVNSNPDRAYKSKKHHDEEENPMSEGYFIVGINTDSGQFSYHYELKYWDLFECEELERAPEYDGHTADDVIRLLPTV